MRRLLALAVFGAVPLAACEGVVGGLDYKAMPTVCSPLAPQKGAPEFLNCKASEKCVWQSSAFACASGVGSSGRGTACTQESQCAQGLNCVYNHCYAYCDTAQPACNDGEVCRPTGRSSGGHVYGACTAPNCNPFSPTDGTPPYAACDPGVPCHFVDSVFVQCNAVGSGVSGSPCGRSADCGPDLFCIFFGDKGGQCRTPCRTERVNADCATRPMFKKCVALANGFVVDGVDYGYCDTP